MELLLGVVCIYLTFLVATVIVNFSSYSTFKKVYKLLPTYTFEELGSNTIVTTEYPNVKIVWFKNDNTFKLTDDIFLFSSIIFNLDPIHLYWHLKYKQWFKNNVKI
jgi:hypothetical protein